jgi:hypothetical protein
MNNNAIALSLESSFQDFISAILKAIGTNKFTHIKIQTGSDSRGEHTLRNCLPQDLPADHNAS